MIVSEARLKSNMVPVFLITISLRSSGPTLRISDRNITVVSNDYENYLRDTTGLSALLSMRTSKSQNVPIAIEILNKAYRTYDYLVAIRETYPFEAAALSIDIAYLDNAGVPTTDVENLFTGKIDRLFNITKGSFKVSAISHEWSSTLHRRFK